MRSPDAGHSLWASRVKTLLDEKGFLANPRGYGKLAFQLSAAVGRSRAWSWQYVRGIHKGDGKVGAGQNMQRAILILLATLDDVPLVVAGSRKVYVLETPGSDTEGALLHGNKKHCGNADCAIMFVPNTPKRDKCFECVPVRRRK